MPEAVKKAWEPFGSYCLTIPKEKVFAARREERRKRLI